MFSALIVALSNAPHWRLRRARFMNGFRASIRITKRRRSGAVFALWMACHTEDEIAEAVGMPRRTVSDVLARIEDFQILGIPAFCPQSRMKGSAGKRLRAGTARRRKNTFARLLGPGLGALPANMPA
jgi:hypothetical protein